MSPIVLVLLAATSVLAAPSVVLTPVGINEVAPPRNDGRLVSSYITERAFEIYDGGDTNAYILTARQIVNDLANRADRRSHALAVGQTIAILTQLANGTPGDACVAANLINAYVELIRNGDDVGFARALAHFIETIAYGLDTIVRLANDDNSVRYSVGPRNYCLGSGRVYAFEPAWEAIRAAATPDEADIIHEEYCTAKFLYRAFNSRTNNVGAFMTAVSLPPVVKIIEIALEPLAVFLEALPTGNPVHFIGAAKQSLLTAF